jgi:hypothetical protein
MSMRRAAQPNQPRQPLREIVAAIAATVEKWIVASDVLQCDVVNGKHQYRVVSARPSPATDCCQINSNNLPA